MSVSREEFQQLESEVATLQDCVLELQMRLDRLETDPVVEVLRDSVVDVPNPQHPEYQDPHWSAP